VGSKIGCGDSAAYIIAMHGRDAVRHVLDHACAVINADPEPDPDVIDRLAELMREIEASQRQQIHRVAELYSAGARYRLRQEPPSPAVRIPARP
jgi:hypothetical protein